MNDKTLDALAVRVLEIWLILMGFKLVGDWDENDLNCRRAYGPHVVYIVSGKTIDDCIDTEKLAMQLERYLAIVNKALQGINFQVYNLEVYDCPCGCGTSLYASICI